MFYWYCWDPNPGPSAFQANTTTELYLHPYDITFSSGGTGSYYITLAASNKQPGWPGTIYLPMLPNAGIKSVHPHHYSVAQFALFHVHTGRCDHCYLALQSRYRTSPDLPRALMSQPPTTPHLVFSNACCSERGKANSRSGGKGPQRNLMLPFPSPQRRVTCSKRTQASVSIFTGEMSLRCQMPGIRLKSLLPPSHPLGNPSLWV